MKECEVPTSVEMFGKTWALVFGMTHPKWHYPNQEHDEWNSYGGYDLNLYTCDGHMSVTAYALEDDGTGYMTTDTSTYKTIVQKKRGHR